MRAILRSCIENVSFLKGAEGEYTEIQLTFKGKADCKMLNAKDVIMTAQLQIKRALADEIKIGDVFDCEIYIPEKSKE
jgi:hypothetical protein